MKAKARTLVMIGMSLIIVAISGFAALSWVDKRTSMKDAPTNEVDRWKWFDVRIDNLHVRIGVPLEETVVRRDVPVFDLHAPLSTAVTSKVARWHINTPEDYERYWTIYENPHAARHDFEEGHEFQNWVDIKTSIEKLNNAPWTPVHETVIGVYYIEASGAAPFAEVQTIASYRSKAGEARSSICLSTVKVGDKWLIQSGESEDRGDWRPYRSALLRHGNAALMECRKRAGVEPYADVLSK